MVSREKDLLMNRIKYTVWFAALILATSLNAEGQALNPVLKPDAELTLKKVFKQALARYPMRKKLFALESEAQALTERGDSLIAAPPALSVRYQDDRAYDNTGLVEYEAGLELPIWHWGQRSAGKRLGKVAIDKVDSYDQQLKYELAKRLREIIWALRLKQNEVNFGYENYKVSEKLLKVVRRRVELGGLPKVDLLLAESNLMEKQSLLEQLVSELEVARKSYSRLTGFERLPANIEEPLSSSHELSKAHPLLLSKQNEVRQLEAELNWISAAGSGQPVLTLGVRSERSDKFSEPIESLGAAINIPFGGQVHKAPKLAAANSQLIQSKGEYELLFGKLKQQFYEVDVAIVTGKRKLQLALSRQEISKKYLKMNQIGFQAGEIGLFDLLKVQEKVHQVLLNSSRQKIILQRDITRYNQTVGLLP